MYQIIGPVQTRTFRVLWLLEELGLSYTHLPEPAHSPLANEHNPSGKVPILLTDGHAITDSTAIMTYLADRHEALTHPAGTLKRARQDSLTQFLLDDIEGPLWLATRHKHYMPQTHRIPKIEASAKYEVSRAFETLTKRMKSPFLTGDTMTIPDIIATHLGTWARSADFPNPGPDFNAYLTRMTNRPAYKKVRKT